MKNLALILVLSFSTNVFAGFADKSAGIQEVSEEKRRQQIIQRNYEKNEESRRLRVERLTKKLAMKKPIWADIGAMTTLIDNINDSLFEMSQSGINIYEDPRGVKLLDLREVLVGIKSDLQDEIDVIQNDHTIR